MATMTAAQLLKVDEKEFDSSIQDMSLKGLLETITVLQREMSREQENFNDLSAELASLKKNSRQYKSVSKDLVKSQTRLTDLMNRSMKCFAQQGNQQAKASVARKNSLKDSQRPDIRNRHSADLESRPAKKTDNSGVTIIKTSTPAKPQSEDTQEQSVSASQSFSEAMNKFGGKSTTQNGNHVTNKKPTVVVSSSNSVSQNLGAVDAAKRPAGNIIDRSESEGKKEDKTSAKTSVVNVGSNQGIYEKKSSPRSAISTSPRSVASTSPRSALSSSPRSVTSVTSSASLGPLASQRSQYMSKSMDSVLDNSKLSEPAMAKPDVVRASDMGKQRSVMVMNSDKQAIDLDSFTDRKNLMAELKAGKVELKQTATKKGDRNSVNEVAINIAGAGTKKSSEKPEPAKPGKSILKANVLGDIKQGKKPSEIKDKDPPSTSVHKTNGNDVYEPEQTVPSNTEKQTVIKKKSVAFGTEIGKNKAGMASSNEMTISDFGPKAEVEEGEEWESGSDDTSEDDVNYVSSFQFPPAKTVFESKSSSTVAAPAAAKPKEVTRPKAAAPPPPKTATNVPSSNHSNQSVPATHQPSKPVEKVTNSIHSSQNVSIAPLTKQTVVNSNQGNQSAPVAPQQPKVVGKVQNSYHSNQTTTVVQQPPKVTEKVTNGSNGNQKVVPAPQAPQMLQKLPTAAGNHGNQKVVAKQEEDGEDELVKDTRVKFTEWDPSRLLSELYKVTLHPENVEDIRHRFIGMEGLMEKLPMNKKKATLLKTWKRRFFKAKDGWLHYYETGSRDKPSDSLQLMGGRVEELGQRVLGVDDGRGKYLMVRVPTENEYGQWKVALESQTADNVKATYVRPSPASPPNGKKKVILIDMGSCGIRAGLLTERPTLPQVFIPSVVAIHKQTGEIIVGADALRPTVRKTSKIHYPIRPTNKVDKFNIDVEMMTAIFKKVFSELGVKVNNYLVMLSTPQNLADHLKGSLMKILVDTCQVRGVCMVHQCLLALYSYNAMSGIIVDIGERLDILPIYDGLLIEGGVSRQAYGGEKIQDSMYISLLENRYRFNTPVEKLFVRYLTEQGCYVAADYKAAKAVCEKDPKYKVTVELGDYYLPEGAHQSVTLDHGFFKAPEGFFNTDLWEMDYKNLQKQIFAAIQQCPMDARKQMYRSVYLSGGVTMVPGFADRLQVELKKLAPPSVQVEVHASPQRYHAAYLGASSVAGMDVFEMSCVMADEWKKLGVKACKKWGM